MIIIYLIIGGFFIYCWVILSSEWCDAIFICTRGPTFDFVFQIMTVKGEEDGSSSMVILPMKICREKCLKCNHDECGSVITWDKRLKEVMKIVKQIHLFLKH